MKLPVIVLVLGVSGAFAMPYGSPGEAARDEGFQSRVLLENAQVLVVENLYPAGTAAPLHTHAWPRVVYVLEGGSLQLEDDAGAVRMEVEAGQTAWRPAETHVVRNVGQSRVRVIEVEVKTADVSPPGG